MKGFFSGSGPWWLKGWKGKIFNNNGVGINVFQYSETVEYKWPFKWSVTPDYDIMTINYDPPLSMFKDEVQWAGDRWRGKIYLWGGKIGTFELWKGNGYGT